MSHVLHAGASVAAAAVAARLPSSATSRAVSVSARAAVRCLANHHHPLRRTGTPVTSTTSVSTTRTAVARRGAHSMSRAPPPTSSTGNYTGQPSTASATHPHPHNNASSGHSHSHSHSHTPTPAAKVKGGPTGMSSKVSVSSPPDTSSPTPSLQSHPRSFHTSTNAPDHALSPPHASHHGPNTTPPTISSAAAAATATNPSTTSAASDPLDAVDPSKDPLPTVGGPDTTADTPPTATSTHTPFLMCLGAAARPKRASTPTPPPATASSTHDPTSLNPHTPTGATQLLTPRPLDCGEDAFFAVTRGPLTVFGVADGVGGWADLGVDPSLFAWELMRNCRHVATHDAAASDPRHILSRAYTRLLDERRVTAGSATAAVLSFDMRTGVLRTANLGDSGYLIVRTAAQDAPAAAAGAHDVPRAVYRSPEQQHYFNAPFQLSVSPDSVRGNISDTPDQAMCAEHQLQAGDVLIVATDGLFDNCFTSDLLYTVQRELTGPLAAAAAGAALPGKRTELVAARVTKLAKALAVQGREFAMNHRRQSPFARAASQVSGRVFSGGKLDDVTVVTAMVVDAPAPADQDAQGDAADLGGAQTTLLYAKV